MFQSNAFQGDAFQRHTPEVVAPPGGGGAGSGGRRRQFSFLNRFDDPEIFAPPPMVPETIERYVEGDPADAVQEVPVRKRADGPTSLADLGRAVTRLRAPTPSPFVEKPRPRVKAKSTPETAAATKAQPSVREKAKPIEAKPEPVVQVPPNEEEEMYILRMFDFL